ATPCTKGEFVTFTACFTHLSTASEADIAESSLSNIAPRRRLTAPIVLLRALSLGLCRRSILGTGRPPLSESPPLLRYPAWGKRKKAAGGGGSNALLLSIISFIHEIWKK
ncbi:MAG: hypothetical protein RI566_13200, partial [Sediminimonas sp.]|uniref:hypothetical protein n=1 Tax=Sediminimonas sp. TaxID=2823379 RepID=UPI0028703D2E